MVRSQSAVVRNVLSDMLIDGFSGWCSSWSTVEVKDDGDYRYCFSRRAGAV